MVTPLDVDVVMTDEVFHNNIGTRSAVKYIADDMEMIYNQSLNDMADYTDKFRRLTHTDNGVQNVVVVFLLVVNGVVSVQQFVKNIGVAVRYRLTDF